MTDDEEAVSRLPRNSASTRNHPSSLGKGLPGCGHWLLADAEGREPLHDVPFSSSEKPRSSFPSVLSRPLDYKPEQCRMGNTQKDTWPLIKKGAFLNQWRGQPPGELDRRVPFAGQKSDCKVGAA